MNGDLESIVYKMVSAGEPEENIALVIQNYNSIKQPPEPTTPTEDQQYDYSGIIESKSKDFDRGIFKMAERQAYDKYKETGELDLSLLPQEEILEKRKYDYTTDVGGQYFVDGKEVSRVEMKDNLFNTDFVEKLQEGKVSVKIKDDQRLEDLSKRQAESGSQLGDKYEYFMSTLYGMGAGIADAKNYVQDVISEVTGIEPSGYAKIERLASDAGVKQLLDKKDELLSKTREYEKGFNESILDGNFSAAANIGFNSVAQSAPITLASMAVGGPLTKGLGMLGKSVASSATISGILIPQEYAEARFSSDPELEELTRGEKLTRSFFRGGAEGFFEGIMGPVGARSWSLVTDGFKSVVKKAGKEGGEQAAKQVANEMADKTAKQMFKTYGIDILKEGGTEALTSLSQDLTDVFMGIKDMDVEELMKNAAEAGSLGVFMGGVTFTPTGVVATKKYLLKNEKVKQGAVSEIRKAQETGAISKKKGDEIIKEFEEFQAAAKQTDPNLSEDKQEEITNLIYEKKNLESKIKDLDPNQKFVVDSKNRIQEINDEISNISQAEDVTVDIEFAEKEADIAKKIIDVRLDNTVKFANERGKELNKKVYVVETDETGTGNEKAKEIYEQYLKDNPDAERQDIENSDGIYLGDVIIINRDVAEKTGAFNVGQHEVLHGVINNMFDSLDTNQKKKFVSDFRNILSKEQLEAIDKRFEAYKKTDPNFDPSTSVEIFTLLSDAVALGQVEFNESLGNKLKNLLQDVLRRIGNIFPGSKHFPKEFSNARQAYNFIKDYNKTAEKGLISTRAKKLAKVAPVSKEATMSKTASDKVQEIYNDQGVAGALDIIQEFKPIVNKIVQRRSEAPGFDRQLLTDEIETGERGILDLIQAYDPESGVPLAAYINKFLPSRAIEASKRVLGEVFEGDIAERVDIAEPTTEVEEVEITEKPKAPTNLRRALDIKEGSELYNKVKDVVAKTFGTRIPEVTDPKFKKTLQDTYATELTNDVKELMGKPSSDKYKTFLQKYGEQIYDLIPQDILNKSYQDFIVEEKKNLSPTEVDDAISKGLLPSDTPRTAGPSLFTKKPYNQEEFVEFHLAPKKGRPASKQTQLAQTIAKELGKDATLEVLEDPKVFERFTEVQEIEGKKVTKETKPKVAEKIQREPGISFSITDEIINVRDIFDIEVNGKDKLLELYNLPKTTKIKSEKDIETYIDELKSSVFILGPKEMWFGPSGGSVFTSSSKIIGVKSSSDPLWKTFISRIKELESDNTIKYGKPIPGVNTKDIWSLRNKYDKLFKSPEIIKNNIKNGEISKFNKQVSTIHKELWKRINNEISKDKSKATAIANYLGITANDTGHWHKLGAQFEGYSKEIKGKRYEYEHAMPATAAYLYLLDAALSDVNFETAYDLVIDNYKLIALDKAMDDKLRNARTPSGYSLQRRMPDAWSVINNRWWQRYFNDIVSKQDGGIDPNSIISLDGKTFGEKFKVDVSGNLTTPELSKSVEKAKNDNIKNLSNKVASFSKTMTNDEVLSYAATLDNALANARKLNAPVKKIRVFDFDDTLAETKSLVFYNKPSDTKTVKPKLKAIVMAGPPGGGKSSIIKGLGLVNDGFKEVNQDISLEWLKTKEGLPAKESDYTKEQKSMRSKLGAQARKIAARKLDKFAKQGDGIILDGTGASVAATEAKIQALEELGYEVSMIYVNTPKETAIARNKARKERSLPNFIVEKTWDAVNANRDVYAGRFGDKFYEVNTEGLKQGEVPQEVSDAIRSDLAATERGRLTAEEFAKQGKDLVDQGFVMDFSDFNIVREGERGPLFDVAKKIRDARGNEDLFVLTARAPESQDAIYEFLKSEGLEFKRENIIGLGNSTGAAKAKWVIGKAAEGYNDFYFADDAYANVEAVQDALDQIDVKFKVQQAKVSFSKSINKDFNKIIEQTTGIASEKRYSKAKAKVRGAGKGNKKFFIPYSAEDFMGLIYPLLSKGTLGDSQMAWFKEHLLDPYGRAIENLSSDRIQMMQDFKELKKSLEVPKDLRKKTESGFTNEQAVRVYLFNKVGHDVPGLSETDLKELIDIVNSNGKLKAFADQILSVTKGDGYVKPAQEWLAGTITTDLIDLLNTTKRKKYLEQSGYLDNANEIFSQENLNKLEAAYGAKYREAVENVLARMKSGKNRMFSGSRLSNRVLDYINGSIGTIMFFNTRSAVLQTISAINFLNWSFNNPYKAGKAFANQPQYWKDFKTLMNSDYLTDRRNGLKLNISENEIANAAATAQNKARGAMNYILQKGYLPTQFADSFAIASGGATFYRNRINDLVKQGIDVKQAEKQALAEWRETAEISQQSSDPSKISQQQASDLGRVILAFANTPMQYARIQKRAFQDLANRRGDAKTNVSKIIYYGIVQNLIFNALQQALFGLGFGDDEDDDKKEKQYFKTANGMLDSTLRGLGIAGATTSVIKNFLMDIYERSGRKRPEYVDAVYKLLALSPPISSKISKVRQAAYQFDSKKRRQEIFDKGFSIDNPAYEAGAKVISATTNLPLDRVLNKVNNIEAALAEDVETWQRVAMLAGWPEWQIMPKEKKNEELPRYPGSSASEIRRKSLGKTKKY